MHAIFISYRQDGSSGWAAYLHDVLQRRFGSHQVFLDDEDIRIGEWKRQIKTALGQCRAFVLVIGPQWLQAKGEDGQPRLLDPTDVHRCEIETALASERITLIPVLVDGAPMPAQRDLPAAIAQLAARQALDLPGGGWRGASSRERLVEEIRHATGLPAVDWGWLRAVKTFATVFIATLLSSIATVVICKVTLGVDLTERDVWVVTLCLLGAWSGLTRWWRRRIQRPVARPHA